MHAKWRPEAAQPSGAPQRVMLERHLEGGVKRHGACARVPSRQQDEIRHVTSGRTTNTEWKTNVAQLLPAVCDAPCAIDPPRKRASRISEYRCHRRLAARRVLSRRDRDFNRVDLRKASA